MGAHLDRAFLLFEQSRPEQAEEELRQELSNDPESPMAHSLLALCLAKRQQYQEATREAQQSVGLAPDLPFPHYALACVYQERNRLREAEQSIREAIDLDPEFADYYAVLASIHLERKQWQAALETAEEGLYFEPEHVNCNNLRAIALVKLGRRAEAGATLDAALSRAPEDAVSHANMGWTLLEKGQPQQAMEHFREALRLEPNLDWARAGIVEALKSRNVIYRLFLFYFLWMAKLSRWGQWGVIIGGYIGYRILRTIADRNPDAAPFIWPLLGLYIAFVVMTWIAYPLFNLLLRLNRFGRLALSREQIVASNWVGGCLLFALLSLAAFGITFLLPPNDMTEFLRIVAVAAAAYFGLLVIPISGTFSCQSGWPRQMMAGYTILLAAVGIAALPALFVDASLAVICVIGFLLGAFLSGFVANAFMMANVKK